MKSILLTGTAGFIGSNFVPYFLEKYPDYNLVNLDLLTYAGSLENCFYINFFRLEIQVRNNLIFILFCVKFSITKKMDRFL